MNTLKTAIESKSITDIDSLIKNKDSLGYASSIDCLRLAAKESSPVFSMVLNFFNTQENRSSNFKALQPAARACMTENMRLIFETRQKIGLTKVPSEYLESAMLECCRTGNLNGIEMIIKNGGKIEPSDLTAIAEHGHLETMKSLRDIGRLKNIKVAKGVIRKLHTKANALIGSPQENHWFEVFNTLNTLNI